MISFRVHSLGSIHNIREDTHSQLLDPKQIFKDTNRTLHHLCGCLSEPSVSGGRPGLPGLIARINVILVSHTDTNVHDQYSCSNLQAQSSPHQH